MWRLLLCIVVVLLFDTELFTRNMNERFSGGNNLADGGEVGPFEQLFSVAQQQLCHRDSISHVPVVFEGQQPGDCRRRHLREFL